MAFAKKRNQHTHPTPAILEDSRDSPQGPRERKSTADLTHARMLHLQELGLGATVTNTLDNEGEPQGFAEASKSDAWMDSMGEELSSLINNQTWTLVDLPPGRKAIRCGCINKDKKNEHGAVYRLKSRLVAKGHSQKPGIDYNDTVAPVGDKVILRFVLSFALDLGYELYQLDIDTAYLYGNLKETIYMIQPEGFDDGSVRICLLQKCIYGLKQSEREWHFRLSHFLKSIGFEMCPKEQCLLVKMKFCYSPMLMTSWF